MAVEFKNYNPEVDYPVVRGILEENGLFAENWDDQEKHQRRINSDPDSMFLATLDGQIVGIQFLSDELYPYAFRLAVRPAFQRRGVGTALMEETMRRLKEHGHTEIGIFVDENNEELKAWYRKMGFNESGIYRSMWRKI